MSQQPVRGEGGRVRVVQASDAQAHTRTHRRIRGAVAQKAWKRAAPTLRRSRPERPHTDAQMRNRSCNHKHTRSRTCETSEKLRASHHLPFSASSFSLAAHTALSARAKTNNNATFRIYVTVGEGRKREGRVNFGGCVRRSPLLFPLSLSSSFFVLYFSRAGGLREFGC